LRGEGLSRSCSIIRSANSIILAVLAQNTHELWMTAARLNGRITVSRRTVIEESLQKAHFRAYFWSMPSATLTGNPINLIIALDKSKLCAESALYGVLAMGTHG
jgi:hypothetical protein